MSRCAIPFASQTALAAILAIVVAMPGCSGCNQSPEQLPTSQPQSDESAQSPGSEPQTPPANDPAAPSEQGEADGQGEHGEQGSAQGGAKGTESNGAQGGASGSSTAGGGTAGGGSLEASPSPGKAAGSGRSAGSQGPARSPAEAAEHARTMKARAQRAAAGGDHAEAFEAAVEAWQAVAAHPGDTACAQLAKELETLLKSYGEATNGSASPPSDDKPIVVQ